MSGVRVRVGEVDDFALQPSLRSFGRQARHNGTTDYGRRDYRGQGRTIDLGPRDDGSRARRLDACGTRGVELLTEGFGPGDGGVGLTGVPAFGPAGVVPGAVRAERRECGVVGAAREMDLDAAKSFVQAPGGSNCVAATISRGVLVAAVAEVIFGRVGTIVAMGPELHGGTSPGGGKPDFPTDGVRAAVAKGLSDGERLLHGRREGNEGAHQVIAVATPIFLGFPLPIKGLQLRTQGQRLAGQVLGLADPRLGILFFHEEEEEIGAAEAGVVVEVVDLRGGVVECQGQRDGEGTFGDGDLVGPGPALGGDEGGGGRRQRDD